MPPPPPGQDRLVERSTVAAPFSEVMISLIFSPATPRLVLSHSVTNPIPRMQGVISNPLLVCSSSDIKCFVGTRVSGFSVCSGYHWIFRRRRDRTRSPRSCSFRETARMTTTRERPPGSKHDSVTPGPDRAWRRPRSASERIAAIRRGDCDHWRRMRAPRSNGDGARARRRCWPRIAASRSLQRRRQGLPATSQPSVTPSTSNARSSQLQWRSHGSSAWPISVTAPSAAPSRSTRTAPSP